MSHAPDPPVPSDTSMTGNDWFPWYFDRLRKSRWWRRSSDLARSRNVMLWGEAYKSVPAGSLADDDDELAEAAGFGMNVNDFIAHKAEIMEPWTLCSDGRWYHPMVCEVVLDAWNRLGEGRKAEAKRKADYRKRVREGAALGRTVPRDNASSPKGQPTLSLGTEPETTGQMAGVPVGLGQQTNKQTLEANASVGSATPEPTDRTRPWLRNPDFMRFWASGTAEGRRRSSMVKAWPQFERAGKQAGGTAIVADAYVRYAADDSDVQRTGGPALHRWLSDGRWEHWIPADKETTVMTDADWQTAIRLWRRAGDWLPRFGPKPGEPGCRAPSALILAEASAVAAGAGEWSTGVR